MFTVRVDLWVPHNAEHGLQECPLMATVCLDSGNNADRRY